MRGHAEESVFTWDLQKQRLAGLPADYSGGGGGCWGGSPSPLLASEVLNPFTVPRLISELPIPCWGLSAPPHPSQRKGFFYTQVDSPRVFFFSFLKEQKRAWG